MRKITSTLVLLAFCFGFYACNTQKEQKEETDQTKIEQPEVKPLVEKVLSAEEQAKLTPDEVIRIFKEGNERFMNNDLTTRDHSAQVRNSTSGQFPKAVILSCLDSRVPVEDVFDRGIGDIFVARVAGNFVNEDILGSMEFGCKVAGAKLILVMGHEHCGAVKAAVDNVQLGNITPMLAKIQPAVAMAAEYEGEKNSKNAEFVHMVCENNVINTINEIRINSDILNEMESNNEIKIIGAIYDMDTGEVVFMDEALTAPAL